MAQKDADVEDPQEEDLHRLGTVIRVIQTTQLPDGTARVVMEGLGRARIREFVPWEEGFRANVELAPGSEREDPERHQSGAGGSGPEGPGALRRLYRGQREAPPGALRNGGGGPGPGSPGPHDLRAPPPLLHGEAGTSGSPWTWKTTWKSFGRFSCGSWRSSESKRSWTNRSSTRWIPGAGRSTSRSS